MEKAFDRLKRLPPYVFAEANSKAQATGEGEEIFAWATALSQHHVLSRLSSPWPLAGSRTNSLLLLKDVRYPYE